jgi:hypothetical protein
MITNKKNKFLKTDPRGPFATASTLFVLPNLTLEP